MRYLRAAISVGERNPAYGELCRLIGFDEMHTATLVCGKQFVYAGKLYSEEYKRRFAVEMVVFQVVKISTDKKKLLLSIDQKPIAEWFKEQFEKIRQNILHPMLQQRKSRGMKMKL